MEERATGRRSRSRRSTGSPRAALRWTGTRRSSASSRVERTRAAPRVENAETSPGQPIHTPPVRSWSPRRAVASPPDEGATETSPPAARSVTGRRFETIKRRGTSRPARSHRSFAHGSRRSPTPLRARSARTEEADRDPMPAHTETTQHSTRAPIGKLTEPNPTRSRALIEGVRGQSHQRGFGGRAPIPWHRAAP